MVPPLMDEKALQRRRCMELRKRLHASLGDAGERACRHFLSTIGFPAGAAISAYIPVGSELDVLPLARAAHAGGHEVGMPVVVARDRPLVFRAWTPGDRLEAGAWNIPIPPADAAPVVPSLLLVPMLAFDSGGYRLGYGGGFYDRTLQELRRSGRTVTAVGVCYAGLEVDAVPRQNHDARLDWIVTEDGAWSTGEVA
ncbi:MAG: 5-formyltetrahydrofolate cyclo-ligase [bacterium]|nr:5-formyltetrahydrofolate cyclo-ligase [bacterium]